jgi:hypothetical protein
MAGWERKTTPSPTWVLMAAVLACTSSSSGSSDEKVHPSSSPSTNDVVDAGPVVLQDVRVTTVDARFGRAGAQALRVSAKARLDGRVKAKLGEELRIHVKALCNVGDHVVVDIASIEGKLHDDGASVALEGDLFEDSGYHEALTHCQLAFRIGDGLTLELPGACLHEGKTQVGACSPAIIARPPASKTGIVTEGARLDFDAPDADPGRLSGSVQFTVTFAETMKRGDFLQAKVACVVGDRTWTDWGMTLLRGGVFEFEAGETIFIEERVYFEGLTDVPSTCELGLHRVTPDRSRPLGQRTVQVDRFCRRGSAVSAGSCDSARPPLPTARAPVDADTFVIDEVALTRQPEGSRPALSLSFATKATHRPPEHTVMRANVSCRIDEKDVADDHTVDLSGLDKGESKAFRTDVLYGQTELPAACTVDFSIDDLQMKHEVALEEPESSQEPATGFAQGVRCTQDKCTVERALFDRLLQDPGQLAREARVVPAPDRGLKLYGIRSGSLAALVGLENGDLVVALDGAPLVDLTSTMAAFSKLKSASSLVLTVERGGKTLTKHIALE